VEENKNLIKINHVAIVVKDIDQALSFWQDALGLPLSHIETIAEQESKVAFLPLGDLEIELVQPITDSSGVAKYLEKKGEGMHHLCFEVHDIHVALQQLKTKGVSLINETPIEGSEGKQLAFIHPKSTNGVLVELYQLPKP
jgi:methylmalonyl-CoA/ethylmalonyl-CoA epimerase